MGRYVDRALEGIVARLLNNKINDQFEINITIRIGLLTRLPIIRITTDVKIIANKSYSIVMFIHMHIIDPQQRFGETHHSFWEKFDTLKQTTHFF